MMSLGVSSYSCWAQQLFLLTKKQVSKQAVFARMNLSWVRLTKKLLEQVLGQKIIPQSPRHLFKHFNRVLLQDSSCLHLPDCLYPVFTGSVSKGKKKAIAKLNLVLDVINGQFIFLKWMSYTITEQALSSSILPIAKVRDLIIRDMGYSAINVFGQMDQQGIFFLSRLKYGVVLSDAQSGQRINLLKLLKGKAMVNHWVYCGKDKKLKVRLVALRLSKLQAEIRKRKAAKNRDKRVNYKEEYYRLLEYVLFITNVREDIWTEQQVADAYRVRWNIEMVFKSWKSGFNITRIIPSERVNTYRIEGMLNMIMLYLLCFQKIIYTPLKLFAQEQGKTISLMKLAKKIIVAPLDWLVKNQHPNVLAEKYLYQCVYDKRSDRINAEQLLYQFTKTLT
jgi:hypothetical protein